MTLDRSDYGDLVRRALAEDLGTGDVTTEAIVPPDQRAKGILVAKSRAVVAGLEVAFEAFRQLDPDVRIEAAVTDGEWCSPGEAIAELRGRGRALLSAERTALNFLQRLSGIATLTRRFVDEAAGRIVVLDTRKTTPTLRVLEKYAVSLGGAANHRMRLDEAILIKENHARLAGGLGEALQRLGQRRDVAAGLPVEVEVHAPAEIDAALAAGVPRLLLDNLTIDEIRDAVRRTRGRAEVEISGGVTLARMRDLATTGAEYVSIGALTHSAPAADISFEVYPL